MTHLYLVGFCTDHWDNIFLTEEAARAYINAQDNPEYWVLGRTELHEGEALLQCAEVLEGEFL